MVAEVISDIAHGQSTSIRSLMLVWQNPETRSFMVVGEIARLASGTYQFRYRETARQEPDFHALDDYPDFDRVYESQALPAFFANRVMSRHRESFPEYLVWLGLEGAQDWPTLPLEVLATTGGSRVTDTFHIVDGLDQQAGEIDTKFFVSGIRHCPGAMDCLRLLHSGDALQIAHDRDNARNHLALRLDTDQHIQIGWIPDWILSYVHPFIDNGTVSVTVERVNEDAPDHLMVLCRIQGSIENS